MTADNIILILIIVIVVLVVVVTIQPIVYMYIISQRLNRIAEENRARFENFNYSLGQIKLDQAGRQDVQEEIEHSLDYLSRQLATTDQMSAKLSFVHTWVSRIDDKFTILNMAISEAVDVLRETDRNIKKHLDQ